MEIIKIRRILQMMQPRQNNKLQLLQTISTDFAFHRSEKVSASGSAADMALLANAIYRPSGKSIQASEGIRIKEYSSACNLIRAINRR